MNTDAKIYVAGHTGMVGSAIIHALKKAGFSNLVTRRSQELDLRDQHSTFSFFNQERPEYVFMAAAKVGGILANKQAQGEFCYDNLMIELNTIEGAHRAGVKKFCFLGSSCIYPKFAEQPIKEEALMTGLLEPTNFGYATAKITGVKLCEAYQDQYDFNYVALMPCNLYGPGDNFHPQTSHVLQGLLRRTIEAKERGDTQLSMWGTGTPRREFLFVDDVASAALLLMNHEITGLFNVGAGEDIRVEELLQLICHIVGYKGQIVKDLNKPDGMPRKLMDIQKISALGWKPEVNLEEGIRRLYKWFLEHRSEFI